MASTGLSSSGMTKLLPSAERLTPWKPTAAQPPPINAPSRPCVVEIGKPSRVARMTVRPAPSVTAKRKYSEPTSASGTSPLPENFLSSACARKIEVTDPANVVTVAQVIDTL